MPLTASVETMGDSVVLVDRVEEILQDTDLDGVVAHCLDQDDVLATVRKVPTKVLLLEFGKSLLLREVADSVLDAGVQECVVAEPGFVAELQFVQGEVTKKAEEPAYVVLCSTREDGAEMKICSDTESDGMM